MAETNEWIDEPTSSYGDEDMAYLCLMAKIQEIKDSFKGTFSTVAIDVPSTSKDAKDLVKPKKVNNFFSLSESENVQAYDSLSVDLYYARSAKKKADLEIKSLTRLRHRHVWYLDNGCSSHMTVNKSLLINYVSEHGPSITFGDNARGITKGYGVLSNGSVTFNRVAYVDELKHNLLSISQLCDLNF
ncbi:uncharacterized protein LOC112501673 [Cynara cardunculus var. scolymus]|uniref:uncharacterized protein LOC112501673 n=1 Tax=Cynara cardunculus var. scolymus TaxID=59895 RepID=UPI000D630076|nr:uncharacterized protein LOC112501673 [Cynara cardunculus var. scolymus]